MMDLIEIDRIEISLKGSLGNKVKYEPKFHLHKLTNDVIYSRIYHAGLETCITPPLVFPFETQRDKKVGSTWNGINYTHGIDSCFNMQSLSVYRCIV